MAAQKIMNACRAQLASILQVNPNELYFTGSGTEANNLALQGVANAPTSCATPGTSSPRPLNTPLCSTW